MAAKRSREQHLIDLMFELAMRVHARDNVPVTRESLATFIRIQLAANGFEVAPSGLSWGTLVRPPEPPPPGTERLTAAAAAIAAHFDGTAETDGAVAAAVLAAADAVDPLRVPVERLKGKVPLVLYFATKEDADDFAELVRGAFANPVEISL